MFVCSVECRAEVRDASLNPKEKAQVGRKWRGRPELHFAEGLPAAGFDQVGGVHGPQAGGAVVTGAGVVAAEDADAVSATRRNGATVSAAPAAAYYAKHRGKDEHGQRRAPTAALILKQHEEHRRANRADEQHDSERGPLEANPGPVHASGRNER